MIIATSSPKKWKLGAELIKWFQGTTFSHILIIKDDLVFQSSHGYVNCTHIDVFLEDNKLIHSYEVEDSKVDFDFVKRQLGKGYGYWQLVVIPFAKWFEFKWNKDKNQHFICSEYVGKALMLDWVTDLTSPKDIDDYLKSLK